MLVYSSWLPIVPLKIKKHIEKLVGTNNLENRLRVHSYGEYNNKCVFAISKLLVDHLELKIKPKVLPGLSIGNESSGVNNGIIIGGGLGTYREDLHRKFTKKFVKPPSIRRRM